MKAAATDGHRLAVINIDNALNLDSTQEEDSTNEVQNFAVTLPTRSLREVERLISLSKVNDLVTLFFDKGQVVFLSLDQILTSRTLEGVYPNYSQLIPDSFSKKLIIDRMSFILALERIAVLADQHNNVIKISTQSSEKSIKISADAQDVGSGFESILVDYQGEDINIAFNVKYLLDGLKAIDTNKVCLSINASTTPAVLSPVENSQDFIYLVMPIQIRSEN